MPIIVITIVVAASLIFVLDKIDVFSPYFGKYFKIVQHTNDMSTSQCAKYIEIHPSATEQKVLDHITNEIHDNNISEYITNNK